MTEDVLAVSAQHPDLFIPFLSVNPSRPDALERIDTYVAQGCRGAKLLQNYWGVDLNDTGLIPYFERIAAHRIPLIVHIGSEYSIESDARYERIEMLELPLACGVSVIAAHMGLGRIEYPLRFWRNLSRKPQYFDRDYFSLLEKLQTIPNLYADISAILVPFRARALHHLATQHQLHQKILFGTDYPVPFPILLNSYDLPWSRRRQISQINNPFDRYMEAILEYFPAGNPIYQNYRKLLPLD
jgi:predicted TIM-barrel fold metal-dependent hydrolase